MDVPLAARRVYVVIVGGSVLCRIVTDVFMGLGSLVPVQSACCCLFSDGVATVRGVRQVHVVLGGGVASYAVHRTFRVCDVPAMVRFLYLAGEVVR